MKQTIKNISLPLLLLVFIFSLLTGVIKFLGVIKVLEITSLPFYWINFIHDWSGIVLIILILIHLALNWNFFVPLFAKKFNIWFLAIAAIVLTAIFLISVNLYENSINPQNKVRQLASAEIKEYQGETLFNK